MSRKLLKSLKKTLTTNKLAVPFEFLYTERMKNKNDVQVHELVNKICELQTLKGNGDFKHSYALGTVQAILDWEVKGFNKGFRTLQEAVNDSYDSVQTEIDALNKGIHADQSERDHKRATLEEMAAVANAASLEELYA
jgi:hypothetical protein